MIRRSSLCPYAYASCPYAYGMTHSPQHTPAHFQASHSANSYAYGTSHTRMIRVSSPSYAYHQKRFHVENVISLTHTRMASLHTRITCALRMARTAPSLFPLQAISYAYGLVSYAYDQRHILQCLPWIFLLRILPVSAMTVQFFNLKSFILLNRISSLTYLTF